jgi:AAA domain
MGRDTWADDYAALISEPNGQRPPGPQPRKFTVVDLEPATIDVPTPTHICGDMLYRGAVHTLSGPPDCGKTTIVCWWMLQAIRTGHPVLFLDEEGGTDVVAERFQALDAQPGERISYLEFPCSTWEPDDVHELNTILEERKPALVVWDSSAAFLARAGLDENAASDVTKFYNRVLTPSARLHNAAVVVIDHDVKNAEPSRYARGSGAKLAVTDVAYKISPIGAFSKLQTGVSKLTVTKDRRGWLHRDHEVTFTPTGSVLTLTIRETDTPSGPDTSAELTPAAEKILSVLGPEPATIKLITDRVVGKYGHGLRRETVSRILHELLEARHVDQVDTKVGRPSEWTLYAL